MPDKWVDKFAKCPFYKRTDLNRIVCEGIHSGTTIHLVHESQIEKKRHMSAHCNSIEGCRRCPIHSLLERMYEE